MTIEHLVYFLALALLAEVVGTIGGFGSSLLFVPIAGLFLDFHSVLGITALFHLSSNISKIALFRNGIDLKLVLAIGIPSVVFVVLGAYLSKYADTVALELGLAIFLMAFSLFMLLFNSFKVKKNMLNAIAGGSVSGLLAGLVGTGGSIRGLTLSAFHLSKDVFIASSAVIDLAVDLSRSFVYFSNGYIHNHDLYLVPFLFAVGLAGTYIGKRVLHKISESQFRNIVLMLVLITGAITLFKSIFQK